MSLSANSSGRMAPLSPVQCVLVRLDGELELSPLPRRKPLSWLPNGFQSYQHNTICRHFSWLKRATWRGKGALCGPQQKCFAAGHCAQMLTERPFRCVTHRVAHGGGALLHGSEEHLARACVLINQLFADAHSTLYGASQGNLAAEKGWWAACSSLEVLSGAFPAE